MRSPPDVGLYLSGGRDGGDGVEVERGEASTPGMVGVYESGRVKDGDGGWRGRSRVCVRTVVVEERFVWSALGGRSSMLRIGR